MQASRKAAAEARWAVMKRDRKNKTTDGYYETVRGVRYLVPYSLEQGDAIRRLAKLAYGGIPDFLSSGRPMYRVAEAHEASAMAQKRRSA